MFSDWDSMDFLGWGLVVVLVLLVAALVTYLVRSLGSAGRRRAAERAELEELRRRVDRQN
nr:hypothetical protein [Sphaerisporangium cinnabarinum]